MMSSGDALGDRMKMYEGQPRSSLVPRMPTLVRIDGKAFHSYTRGLPSFDPNLLEAMNQTAITLCKELQTVQFAFVQSDEISLLLHPYKKYGTQAWFDNSIQKMVSVSASIAAATFTLLSPTLWGPGIYKPAYFDSRVWVVPEVEVVNYFLWRQQDWTRNSVQMMARQHYSQKQTHKKNNSELQEMIHQAGENWNDLPTHLKRGRCIIKETYEVGLAQRSRWVVDNNPPIFSADRNYIEKYLAVVEEGV